MNELERLYNGLQRSNTLLMREVGSTLECSFIRTGIVQQVVVVKDDMLAAELQSAATQGILEGEKLQKFRSTFDSFELHIKAKRLYLDLRFSLNSAAAARNSKVSVA